MTRLIGLTLFFLPILAATAQAGPPKEVVLKFGPPDFKVSTGAQWIWKQGEFFAQSFRATGLDSVDRCALVFDFENMLNSGAHLDMDVLINDVKVGTVTVRDQQRGPHKLEFSFKMIKGPDFAIKFLASNTVPPGQGQVELADAWLKFAESLKGPPSIQVRGRAYDWYCEALRKLEGGLTKVRVQNLVDELGKQLGREFVPAPPKTVPK